MEDDTERNEKVAGQGVATPDTRPMTERWLITRRVIEEGPSGERSVIAPMEAVPLGLSKSGYSVIFAERTRWTLVP